jgi:hypothetical protein
MMPSTQRRLTLQRRRTALLVGLCALAAMAIPASASAASWSSQSMPNPKLSGLPAGNNDISCSSKTACMAVGEWSSGPGETWPYAARWNGTKWTLGEVPLPEESELPFGLKGVSCPTANFCVTGGVTSIGGAYIPHAIVWNGTKWTAEAMQGLPAETVEANISEISCPSTSVCVAVGEHRDFIGESVESNSLMEIWNGSEWSLEEIPNPEGAVETWLTKVSCASASSCTAIGQYVNSKYELFGFETIWDGSKWSSQALTNPSQALVEDLSCTTAGDCMRVGTFFDSGLGKYVPFAARRTGGKWSTESLASLAGGAFITGISCVSSSACTAVGASGAGSPIALHWNGTKWTLETVTNGGSAISCTAAEACMAVGSPGFSARWE